MASDSFPEMWKRLKERWFIWSKFCWSFCSGDSSGAASDSPGGFCAVCRADQVGHRPHHRVPAARGQREGSVQLSRPHDRHASGQAGPEHPWHAREDEMSNFIGLKCLFFTPKMECNTKKTLFLKFFFSFIQSFFSVPTSTWVYQRFLPCSIYVNPIQTIL